MAAVSVASKFQFHDGTNERAVELANKMYYTHGNIDSKTAKICALIAVEEVLNSNPTWFKIKSTHKYWEAVRDALNAL